MGMMEGLDQILVQRTMKELGLNEDEAIKRVQEEVDRRTNELMKALDLH